jgi:hypothetical protein
MAKRVMTAAQANLLRRLRQDEIAGKTTWVKPGGRALQACRAQNWILVVASLAREVRIIFSGRGRAALAAYEKNPPRAMSEATKAKLRARPKLTAVRDITPADVLMAVDHTLDALGLHEPPAPDTYGTVYRLYRAPVIEQVLAEVAPYAETTGASWNGKQQVMVARKWFNAPLVRGVLDFLRLELGKKTRRMEDCRGCKIVRPRPGVAAAAGGGDGDGNAEG